jgi:hypothetical protein
VLPPVWLGTFDAGVVTFAKLQTQPVVAAGSVKVPTLPEQLVPTLIVKATVPLLAGMVGEVQNPADAVGAVLEAIGRGDAPKACHAPLT